MCVGNLLTTISHDNDIANSNNNNSSNNNHNNNNNNNNNNKSNDNNSSGVGTDREERRALSEPEGDVEQVGGVVPL